MRSFTSEVEDAMYSVYYIICNIIIDSMCVYSNGALGGGEKIQKCGDVMNTIKMDIQ